MVRVTRAIQGREEGGKMSVFRWRYDETCEGRYCCGDCDKCDKEDEEDDEA